MTKFGSGGVDSAVVLIDGVCVMVVLVGWLVWPLKIFAVLRWVAFAEGSVLFRTLAVAIAEQCRHFSCSGRTDTCTSTNTSMCTRSRKCVWPACTPSSYTDGAHP